MSHQNCAVMIAGIANSGMEEYVKHGLSELMEHARKEVGCIIYNVHQSMDNPSEFMVYMIWETKAAFERHNQTPEMQVFKKELAKIWFVEQSPKTYWHLL